ncbi:MAG: glycosyltransferase family 4 protein [candidate division Zixibacteria bacterium]|nr:glycosyltransferase family 4 protein [candidate division Zixibacteria bacterium]MDD5427113.1 glycosyltransferase family 4 protein [candidate division Zixibacteria bacterium]
MKILLITHLVPYPPKGGVTLRNYNLLKETAAYHDIYMVTFYQRVHHKSEQALMEGIEEIRKLCRHLEVFPIPSDFNRLRWYMLLFFNLFTATPYSAWRYSSRAMTATIKKLLKEQTFDLMELGTIALGNFGRLAPELPKVMVHHNIESHLLYRRSRYVKNPLAKIYIAYQAAKLKRFERKMAPLIDYHTTCSQPDRELLLENYPRTRVDVVPNGVDTEYFQTTDDPVVPGQLIYVGGMTWFPNYDAMKYFIEDIWPLIIKELPHATLVHIGRQTSREFEKISQINPAVRFLGFADDIRPEITRSSVYIVPLRIGGGTRLKILDAFSMSSAVVSTSIGCEGIEVTDGKDILIADDPATFARKIITLCTDDELRENMKKQARLTAVTKYSWKIIAPKLEEVYRKAVAGRHLTR